MTSPKPPSRAAKATGGLHSFSAQIEALLPDQRDLMTPDESTVRELFAALDASSIETALGLWTTGGEDPAVICEMAVTYRRHDGSQLILLCANVFRFRDGRIADYRIYMDINPVFTLQDT
jgi:ketosteroid isomerase-like protein